MPGVVTSPSTKLVTQAGRDVLRPLGLLQKGRSRTWLDDHGWWLGVVEFQPSGFSMGTYLNVGVTWLFDPGKAYLFFDLSGRIGQGATYESDEQFGPEARRLADRAALEVEQLRSRLPDLDTAAQVLHERALQRPRSWNAWYAAVALGLCGRSDEAAQMFEGVILTDDDRDWWTPIQNRAVQWQRLVIDDVEGFRSEAVAVVRENREVHRLPPDHYGIDEL
jgi:hypothetical protein